MYTGVATIIATELNKMGFSASPLGPGVIVSLNRPVSVLEVEMALGQVFEEITFKVRQSGSKVMVEE